MAAVMDLVPNRDLINPNFDHYQLSLDAIPSYNCAFDKNLDAAKPSESSFTSHHAKLFSLHNHLFSDPWNDSGTYLCDRDWNIRSISKVQSGKVNVSDSCYQVPDAINLRLSPSRLNVSLTFPSPQYAVITNGSDSLSVVETGPRNTHNKWKILFTKVISVAGTGIQLLDSVYWSEGENLRLECLIASVEDVEGETKEKHRSPYITVLSWLTLASVDGKVWTMERSRRLEGSRPVTYACLEADGAAIHIASQRIYKMVEDTVKPVDTSESWEVVGENVSTSTLYTWSQSVSDLTVHLTLPEDVTKANLNISIGSESLEVGIKNGIDLIKGLLHAHVAIDASTWTLDGRRLEISLQKVEEGIWSTVVQGDTRGELVLTSDQVEVIHQRLAHLTSEHWNDNPELANKPYNSQMLEDCDVVKDDGVLIMRVDGETHQISHKVIANTQFLFSTRLTEGKLPAFCLRHDVDGFLWQATDNISKDANPWQHVRVLNAFGYVLASKERQRFCTCSPDMSVAVIADSHRHIYLYRQKVSVLTPLRNRKTGQQVSSVAKQQVLTLDCTPDNILGIKVTNTKVLVVTEQKLYVYVINSED